MSFSGAAEVLNVCPSGASLVWATHNQGFRYVAPVNTSGFPRGSDGKAFACTWRRKWQPTPVFLPGKFHGWRSLVGYSPWGCKELDTTERLHWVLWSILGAVARVFYVWERILLMLF